MCSNVGMDYSLETAQFFIPRVEVRGFWWGNMRERDQDATENGRIILKCIFRKWDRMGH